MFFKLSGAVGILGLLVEVRTALSTYGVVNFFVCMLSLLSLRYLRWKIRFTLHAGLEYSSLAFKEVVFLSLA